MKLLVNEQEFPILFASNQITFTGDEHVMSTLSITVASESQAVFDALGEIFDIPGTVITQGEGEPDIIELASFDLTIESNSNQVIATLNDYIPEYMNLNYSEQEDNIQLFFKKEV